MRKLLTFPILVMVICLAAAQQPGADALAPRYGIPANPRVYPQTDPKTALNSAIQAATDGRFDYLVAHLLDPKFVEERITERANLLEAAVDADLRVLRRKQQGDPSIDKREQLPNDPPAFAEAVRQEARQRAFRQVVQDVRDKMTEDQMLLKELRRFLREGDLSAEGTTARFSLKDVPDRQVFVTQVRERWHVENRQREEEK
jgi:hypothetical protein